MFFAVHAVHVLTIWSCFPSFLVSQQSGGSETVKKRHKDDSERGDHLARSPRLGPRRTFCLPSLQQSGGGSPSLSLPSSIRREAATAGKTVRKWKPPQVFLAQCSSCETSPVRSCPVRSSCERVLNNTLPISRFKDYSWQEQVNLPAEGPDCS